MLPTRPTSLKVALALLTAWPAASAMGQYYEQDRQTQQSQQRDQQQDQRYQSRDQRSQSQDQRSRQQDQRYQSQDQRNQSQDQRSRQQSQRDQQSRQQQSQRNQDGFLIIGYDLNSDGKTDVYYMIDDVQFERISREMDRQRQAQRPADQRFNQQDSQRSQYGQQQSQSRQQTTISGTIKDTRRVTLDNQRDEHNLVRIELQNGRSETVNLGPDKTLSDLNLDRGDTVRITGRRGTINGRSVVMAQSIQANGRTFNISTQGKQKQSQQGQASFSGKVEDTTRISLQGQQREHNLVRIRTQDGKSQFINLGPDKELSDLNVSTGDEIRVKGQRGQIDGHSVVFAQSVEVDGDTTQISWDQQRQGEGVYATPRDQQDQRSGQYRQQDQRSRQQYRQQDQQRSQEQGQSMDYTFRGTLQAFYRTTVPYAAGERNLVKMWLEDGESMIIDLGSQTTLQDLGLVGLADDERVVVRGKPTQIAGRTVLKAETITIDGKRTQLQQSNQSQSQQRQQQGQTNQQQNESDQPWWQQD